MRRAALRRHEIWRSGFRRPGQRRRPICFAKVWNLVILAERLLYQAGKALISQTAPKRRAWRICEDNDQRVSAAMTAI
jgi:hypothetical protein